MELLDFLEIRKQIKMRLREARAYIRNNEQSRIHDQEIWTTIRTMMYGLSNLYVTGEFIVKYILKLGSYPGESFSNAKPWLRRAIVDPTSIYQIAQQIQNQYNKKLNGLVLFLTRNFYLTGLFYDTFEQSNAELYNFAGWEYEIEFGIIRCGKQIHFNQIIVENGNKTKAAILREREIAIWI